MWLNLPESLCLEMIGHLKKCSNVVLEGLRLKPRHQRKGNSISSPKGHVRGFGHLFPAADRSRQRAPPVSHPRPSIPPSLRATAAGLVFTPVSWPGRQVHLPTSEDLVLLLLFFTSLEKEGALHLHSVIASYSLSPHLNQIVRNTDLFILLYGMGRYSQ